MAGREVQPDLYNIIENIFSYRYLDLPELVENSDDEPEIHPSNVRDNNESDVQLIGYVLEHLLVGALARARLG